MNGKYLDDVYKFQIMFLTRRVVFPVAYLYRV